MTDRIIGGALRVYVGLAFLFIFAPIITLVVFSFNVNRFPSLPWSGTGTIWYQRVFDDPDIIASFKNSLIVGVVVALVATFLGATAAYFVNRWNFKGKNPYLAVAILPPTIPLIVLGLALLTFLTQVNLSGARYSIIISHIVLASAFAMAIVRMRLTEMDPTLEEAAWNLGSGQWRAIKEVILPQTLPALIASFLLTMAVSFDEFIIAWFVSGLDVTLPVKIFALLQGQVSPRINAIGTIVFGITMTLVVLAQIALMIWKPGQSRGGEPVEDVELDTHELVHKGA